MGRKNLHRAALPGLLLRRVEEAIERGDPDPLASIERRSMPTARTDRLELADLCWLCLQPGHKKRECPKMRCDRCGGQGHMKRQCPDR